MRRMLLILAVMAVTSPRQASAQAWFDSILPEKSFDFGTVARGSKLTHTFRLVNTTNYNIHIADSRTKCGCTDVKIGAHDIPPGAQTVIEATLDTTKFVGFKPSGLTLVLDQPEFRELDLNFSCFIRGDVTLNPGAADFGSVARGGTPSLVLNLTYAGGLPNWDISKIHTISDHVKAQGKALVRSEGTAQYEITVTLKPTAPAGFFKDEVTLLTNDPSSPSIPISVAATIQAGVTIFPSILNLGPIKAGSVVTKDILVRSTKPFKVTEVKARSGDLSATVPETTQVMHRLKVTLKAPAETGPYHAILEIATDLKDEPPARMTAFAVIVP